MTKADKKGVVTELETYRKQEANILIPSTKVDGLSEFHKAVIDSVTLSAKPDDGDVYKHQDNKYIITGQGLQKLSVCAGVVWNPRETKATATQQRYVAYNAVGCIRKADGTQVCFQAEYDIDIDIVEDEITDSYQAKRETWLKGKNDWFRNMSTDAQEGYIQSKIRQEVNFKKKHKTKLAATGARNRVIRALLGLKKTYSPAELAKPFVMPRVILQPDYSDPEVKKLMLQASIQSITGVFGPTPAPEPEPAYDLPPENYNTVVEPVPDDEEPPGGAEPPPPPAPKEVFESGDKDAQASVLNELAVKKNYDTNSLAMSIEDMDQNNRSRFFDHLSVMADVRTGDDDIPF